MPQCIRKEGNNTNWGKNASFSNFRGFKTISGKMSLLNKSIICNFFLMACILVGCNVCWKLSHSNARASDKVLNVWLKAKREYEHTRNRTLLRDDTSLPNNSLIHGNIISETKELEQLSPQAQKITHSATEPRFGGLDGVWTLGDNVPEHFKIEGQRQTLRISVLVFKNDFEGDVRKAASGASMGELVFYNTILRGLNFNGIVYDFARDRAEFKRLHKSTKTYDIVITDTYSIPAIEDYIAKERCKFRIIDYWGTPPSQNHLNLHLWQFWTPFDFQHPSNYMVGNMIDKGSISLAKKWQGLVWGKEPRYFQAKWHIIHRIAAFVPLILTAKDMSRQVTMPKNVTNLGIVSEKVRSELLADSLFIIGLGDPVLGATPLEAIASGAAYINPQYDARKSLWQNSKYACTSQHTFAENLGPPFVYNYREGDAESAIHAVRLALQFNNSRGFPPYVDFQHRPLTVSNRILESLKMRFHPVYNGGCNRS